MTVQQSKMAEIEGAEMFEGLLAEYAAESAIAGLPPPRAKLETYRSLEAAGALHVFSAVEDDRLVGFITVLVPVLPHYSVPVAVSESFFVAKAYRKGGAGLRLLSAAEAKAAELGSPGLLVSAPFGGRLFEVLPRRGYTETNRVFFKKGSTGLATIAATVPAMSDTAIAKVYQLESLASGAPQIPIATDHVLHGGMYARTILIPKGVQLTGALVKVATTLVVHGDVLVYLGRQDPLHLTGYNVLPASANRKQAFVALTDVYLTMLFPTDAETVEEAERQFTDEADRLASRRDDLNSILITGE